MKSNHFKNQFEPINAYAMDRLKSSGDVYGWAPLEDNEEPSALLLISQDTPLDSFPDNIAGIKLVLKRISPPEVHKQ
jgi:hypothetical protein